MKCKGYFLSQNCDIYAKEYCKYVSVSFLVSHARKINEYNLFSHYRAFNCFFCSRGVVA